MADRPDGFARPVRTDDWPAQAADGIVKVVGTVRDATTTKALTAAKAAVYGIPVAVAGVTVALVVVVLFVRILDAYLPDAWFGETHTWAAHLLIGAVLSLVGIVLLRAARRPEPADD
jgi:hypothetical protein